MAALAAAVQDPSAQNLKIPAIPTKSARIQHYTFTAQLHEDATRIQTTGRIEFDNPSPAAITELEFHLYWNGWKNTSATWLREADRGLARPGRKVRDDSFATTEIQTLRLVAQGERADDKIPAVASSIDVLTNSKFVAPDDQNLDDETVLRVPLPVPLQKGESVALDVAFDNIIPRTIARTGRKDDFVFIAHWYPKIGVYEKRAGGTWGWNTHQFHANTEFFHEYSNYDVTIVLPLRYEGKVGATGKMVDGPFRTNDTVRYRFVQNDVHNFAWTADPEYIIVKRKFVAEEAERDPKYAAERDRIAKATGLTAEELKLTNVDVTILLQPEHANQADRHFRATYEGLRWYGLWYGRYPYEVLTVVDPRYSSGASGMEYPTLFTAGTRRNPSANVFTPEGVTIHEFGHQHFYGLIGSNEFEHAWLDEGLNTYAEGRTLTMAYGGQSTETAIGTQHFDGRPLLNIAEPASGIERLLTLRSVAYPTPGESEIFNILPNDPALRWYRQLPFLNFIPERENEILRDRSTYLSRGPKADRTDRASYTFLDSQTTGTNSYQKPATVLHTLERIVGPDAWARVMRAYCAMYRFEHPRPEDFFNTIRKFAGPDADVELLDSFIKQTFGGSNILDYGVEGVRNRELQKPMGYFGRGDARRRVTSKDKDPVAPGAAEKKLYESDFIVKRFGEIEWPVKVEWKREGESSQFEIWNGKERWWRKALPPGPKLEWVKVDPERKLLIDSNFLNNNYFVEGDGRPTLRWTLRALLHAETQLQFFGSLR
ncbi:MAG: M1 family metallopeptidase [Planctomycetota bacterium]